MLLGALLDAGVALNDLRGLLSGLPLEGYTLEAAPAVRGALGATHARVVSTREEHMHRHLSDVLAIIEHGDLPERVKRDASDVFRRLAAAEARVHRVAVEDVHFHEVGAVDAIVDIVGVCAGLRLLGVEELYCSPLPLGQGQATMAHGTLPLPAPAVLELLAMSGAPTVPHTATTELVTPTGAALVTTLARFAQPPLRLARVGYGAGTRAEPAPNLLRLWLGERDDTQLATISTGSAGVSPLTVQPASIGMQDAEDSEPLEPDDGRLDSQRTDAGAPNGHDDGEGLTVEQLLVLETNIDDMPAELFGHAMERLLAAGALDAWCAPLTMKKSRPGVLLGALCCPADRAALVGVFLRETSTFGVRERAVTRYAAAREVCTVATSYGSVRVKLKLLDGVVSGASPEYEDCRRLSVEQDIPLPRIYAAAVAAASNAGDVAAASAPTKSS